MSKSNGCRPPVCARRIHTKHNENRKIVANGEITKAGRQALVSHGLEMDGFKSLRETHKFVTYLVLISAIGFGRRFICYFDMENQHLD